MFRVEIFLLLDKGKVVALISAGMCGTFSLFKRGKDRENNGSEYPRAKTPSALDGAKIDFIKERLAVSSKGPPSAPRGRKRKIGGRNKVKTLSRGCGAFNRRS